MLLTNATPRYKSQYCIEQNLVSMEFHLALTYHINAKWGVFLRARGLDVSASNSFLLPLLFSYFCITKVSGNDSLWLCMEDTSVGEANPYNAHIVHYVICAKYGFAQPVDCPAQSSDRYFVKQSMDLLRTPWIVPSVLRAKYGSSRWGFVLFWSHGLYFEVIHS